MIEQRRVDALEAQQQTGDATRDDGEPPPATLV
jgi:hypothetical protein